MGSEKVNERQPSLLSRACRLPRKLADRVSELSDTLYKEHLQPLKSETHIPFKFLTVAILLLMYLPWTLFLTYAIPPEVSLTSGNEISNLAYCQTRQFSEIGVTHATLLNNTPFTPGNNWEVDIALSNPNYDFNRYTRSESDGYHMEFVPNERTSIIFRRMMQVPLFNYSDISMFVEVEKISGSAGIYLEAFADSKWNMTESYLEAGQIKQFNLSAPLGDARPAASSWLSRVLFKFTIGSDGEAQVIIRRVIIEATFTANLCHTQIDVQSTENISLYENPSMYYLMSPPRIMLVRNNSSDSAAIYEPNRANDELFLPPGTYEGMTYWQFFGSESPDPNNATTWRPNVNFTVLEDTALEIDVRLYAIRLDIDLSPHVLLRSISISFIEAFQYSVSQSIIGSTLGSPLPSGSTLSSPLLRISDSLYIPGRLGLLYIQLTTWSTFSPRLGWGAWGNAQVFRTYTETYLDVSNSSRNLRLSVDLPYVTIGNTVLGLGDFALFAVVGLLLIGFVKSMHRPLRNSGLRHSLSDSRLLPIAILGLSIFLPWSCQLVQNPNSTFDVVYWISWLSMPLMIRWTDSTPVQILCSTADWWNASLISTFLLFVPLFYACFSLSSPETKVFDRRFALALFLPYLVVLNGFNISVLSMDNLSIGPLLVISALPIWLVRIALRRLEVTR
jgi:hypothetical protein